MNHTLSLSHATALWNKVSIWHDISISLHSGEIICLIGPNGVGKSTLITALAGIDAATLHVSAQPSFDKTELKSFSRKEIAQRIAYMPQHEQAIWNYTVQDVVLTGRFAHKNTFERISAQDRQLLYQALSKTGITHLKSRSITTLSGGEFQKVRLARSLLQEPFMLLLDEPLAGLDCTFQEELLALLKDLSHKQNIGILMSIHDINTAARIADRIAVLGKKNYFFVGSVQEVLCPNVLNRAYRAEFVTFMHPYYLCPQVACK